MTHWDNLNKLQTAFVYVRGKIALTLLNYINTYNYIQECSQTWLHRLFSDFATIANKKSEVFHDIYSISEAFDNHGCSNAFRMGLCELTNASELLRFRTNKSTSFAPKMCHPLPLMGDNASHGYALLRQAA